MRRWTLLGGWLVVLVLATTLTWQIVSAADDRVSERPIAPLNVAAPVITTLLGATSTTTPGETVTSASGSTSTSPPPVSTTATDQTVTTSSTPTTTETAWQTRSVQTTGGVVLLRYRPGEVAYQSATPAPGFKVEVEKKGPPEVKLEFESESKKVEIEASWGDGQLKVNVSAEGED